MQRAQVIEHVQPFGDELSLRVAVATLAAVGLAISIYLTVIHYGDGSPICLTGGEECRTVQQSSYATIAGVPVAAIGIAGYLALLFSALLRGDAGRFGGLTAALVGAGFSAYLTYLELFVIDAICQWCVANAVVMGLILALSVGRALRFGGAP